MPARIILICQASTRDARAGRFPRDEPIEPRSAARAAAMKPLLPSAGHAWTSPDLAARQTCDILGLAAEAASDLRDIDYGRWSGRRLKEIAQEEPDAFALWLSDPASAPHGGESRETAFSRVDYWLKSHANASLDAVAVVSATIFRIGICISMKAGSASFSRIDADPLSSAIITSNGIEYSLRFSPRLVP